MQVLLLLLITYQYIAPQEAQPKHSAAMLSARHNLKGSSDPGKGIRGWLSSFTPNPGLPNMM
jgi:hypothetical protein